MPMGKSLSSSVAEDSWRPDENAVEADRGVEPRQVSQTVGGDDRDNPGAPSSRADDLFAAWDRLEQRIAAAVARARESVVALEYTASDAPAGTRRVATGVVINNRGEILSVRIDPASHATGAGSREEPGVDRSPCTSWAGDMRSDGWRPTPRPG